MSLTETDRRFVLAVDIDDVLCDTMPAFLDFTNKKFNLDIGPADYNDDWVKMWGLESAEAAEPYIEEWTKIEQLGIFAPVAGSQEAIAELSSHPKVDIVLPTSRRTALEKVTHAWTRRHYGEAAFKGIHFAGFYAPNVNGHDGTKGALYTELGANAAVDDHTKHIRAAVGVASMNLPMLYGTNSWTLRDGVPEGAIHAPQWSDVTQQVISYLDQAV